LLTARLEAGDHLKASIHRTRHDNLQRAVKLGISGPFVVLSLALAAVAAGWGSAGCGANAPDPILAEERATGAGKVTIVEFVDYRCTFCRQQTDVLAELLQRHAGAVRFVVKHVPSDKRPGAKRAAQAAICAEAQGKLESMHEALMRASNTTDQTILDLAQEIGLDLEGFKACLSSDAPNARLADDLEAFERAGGNGLPMTFVGRTKFVGLADPEELDRAMRDALDRMGL
jgi:protein-disulfide isomerase